MFCDPFNVLFVLDCLCFVEVFFLSIYQWYQSEFFFFFLWCLWFGHQGDGGLIEWVSSSENFWNSFRRIGVSLSLNISCNSPVKPSSPKLLFLWFFLNRSFNICTCDWLIFSYLLFLVGWVLGDCTFLRICTTVFLSFPFYCHIGACSSLVWSFGFLCSQL